MKKVIADIEAFNCHIANTGHELARDIPPADIFSESYLFSTNTTSFKSRRSNEVQKLLEKLETKKATVLDNLSFKIL